MCYVGIPAIMFGRNRHVGWGITNNICSQRDLYKEQYDESKGFLFEGAFEPAGRATEVIAVRGAAPVELEILFSRHGPVVNHLLAPAAADSFDCPVSFKWVGAAGDGWLEALLAMDRAATVEGFKDAMRPWHCPTFNLAVGDTAGSFGLVSVGRIPVRARAERGMRDGSLASDEWLGYIPYDAMPHAINPPARAWLGSANNRLASDDYPYHLSGTWSDGHRCLRIRQMFEAAIDRPAKLDLAEFRAMQVDVLSLRAVSLLGPLLRRLAPVIDCSSSRGLELVAGAKALLLAWDGACRPDLAAPTIFNCFFREFCDLVAAARFDEPERQLFSPAIEGLAAALLRDGDASPNLKFTGLTQNLGQL
jgi:penicillin amidase